MRDFLRNLVSTEKKTKIKKARRNWFRKLSGILNNSFLNYSSEKKQLLLIPPTTLDGSFGDELMTIATLSQYSNIPTTLYCEKVLKRDDLFQDFKNVSFLSQNYVPNYNKFNRIYLLGADNLTGTYGMDNPLLKSEILNAGNKRNIETRVLGFSMKTDVNPIIKKAFTKLIPQTKFYLRESDSFRIAQTFLPQTNIFQVADIAFLCPHPKNTNQAYQNWIQTQRKENRIIVAVCPNAIHAKRIGEKKYLKKMQILLAFLHKHFNIAFALLYHDLRPQCNRKSDCDLSKDIYIELKDKVKVYYTSEIANGLELKSYLEDIDFTISGRMHFGISGYSLEKPMFGMAYEDKFSGLQKLFEIDPKESLVNFNNIESAMGILPVFIQKLEQNTQLVKKNLETVKILSTKNFN